MFIGEGLLLSSNLKSCLVPASQSQIDKIKRTITSRVWTRKLVLLTDYAKNQYYGAAKNMPLIICAVLMIVAYSLKWDTEITHVTEPIVL